MYQSHNQSIKEQSISDGADLFLLFDKYSGTSRTNEKIDKIQRSVSTPTSPSVSPFMSEKECTDQARNDSESPKDFNLKSRRMSLNKAERRAEHNAIERARRECLNSKFQQLAEALPNLQSHRRPSKGQIVEKALDWVRQNMSKEDTYQYQIMRLQNENKRLLSQISLVRDSDIRTSPVSSSASVTAPFPANLRQQQFPASSTPSAIDSSFVENDNTHIPNYYHQEDMPSMYPIGRFDWQNSHPNINSSAEYLFPTATISAPSLKFVQSEDDNDSNSSEEEAPRMPMAYNEMTQCSLFGMNHPLDPSSNVSSRKTHQVPNYTYQTEYALANTTSNPVFSHNTYY